MGNTPQQFPDAATDRLHRLEDMIVQIIKDFRWTANPICSTKVFEEVVTFLRVVPPISPAEFSEAVDSLVASRKIFRHPKKRPGEPAELWLTIVSPGETAAA